MVVSGCIHKHRMLCHMQDCLVNSVWFVLLEKYEYSLFPVALLDNGNQTKLNGPGKLNY